MSPARRVLFVVTRPLDTGSGRTRVGVFLEPLKRRGVDARVVLWAPRRRAHVARAAARILAIAARCDVVVLQKPALPPWLLVAVRRVARRLVVDVDDAVWVSPAAAYAVRFDHAARLADLVVAGGNHLAAEISGRVPTPVEVVPAAIDLAAVRPADGGRHGPPTFVWTGSNPNYADFDEEVVAALRNATAAGARVRFVSDRPPPFAVEHELTPWTPEAEAAALAASDVGLMPLRDEPRSRGRCGYKAALYLAAGLPVVAADVGVAPEIVGDVGALVEPGGWSGTLTEIVRRPDQWRRLAPRARARAEVRHDREVLADRWAELLGARR